jgi:hypothetical protein
MPLWTRIDGGFWNGDASANPATGVGGMTLAGTAGQVLYPTVGGPGTVGLTLNFGATAFAQAVPAGFTGCPAAGGGFTTLDPATVQGAGASVSGGNLHYGATSVQGLARAADGYTTGAYYFEALLTVQGLTSNHVTCGVAIDYPADPGAPTAFTNFGLKVGGGAAGGTIVGGNIGTVPQRLVQAGTEGNNLAPNFATLNAGQTICIAFRPEGPAEAHAGVGDFWFSSTPSFVDLTDVANRRRFVGADISTPFLGSNGSLPFNRVPDVFFSRSDGANPDLFAFNRGGGGTFTLAGGLDDAGSRPTCSENFTPGISDTPQGANPTIWLSQSFDGARTYSTLVKPRSIGRQGEYQQRVRWLKLGQARTRVLKLEITDPVRRNIVGFYLDTEEGTN